ncbi:MAG: ABC transporter ATP-binding protein [bacterium]|nr:ABC transporter ATP-binding protein [bacterium]MDE0289130.1 ABC transporter ATP-binding protein [bacterium]MDE0440369.1 ABC transporter ATP-binding protein [bacterium]
MPVPIRLTGVTKSYGKARGVIDLDLEVRSGEVFGYLGPNGAGKTTTIRMLVDLIRPQRGKVEVLGGSPTDPTIRRRVGYLPGEVEFYEHMGAGDLLTYIGNLRGDGGAGLAGELSERIDLDLSRRIGDLSKGNRQKLALVQALMHRPELVILDEPTSGLDPLVQQEVYRLLDELRDGGVTIFFSSHVLSEVERVADRVGIIREGQLVEVEKLEALRQRAVRTFEVVFEDAPTIAEFENLEGVRSAQLHGNTLHCQVIGSIDQLLKAVARHPVRNLVSHGADLEALFLDYYRGEEAGHAE